MELIYLLALVSGMVSITQGGKSTDFIYTVYIRYIYQKLEFIAFV